MENTRFLHGSKPMVAVDALKVLIISDDDGGGAGGLDPATPGIVLVRERSADAAARRLDVEPVDAVLMDAAVVVGEDIEAIRSTAARAAVVLTASHDGPDIQELANGLGAAELLPAGLPAATRWQVVRLAAERARLAAELERRTRELEQSETRFRDIIERNADAIVLVDREGVVRYANRRAEEMLAIALDDLVGTPFGYPMVAGETTELDLVRNGGALVAEMRVVETEWQGQRACIASLRDITERKRAEESARRLIQEQSARTVAEETARRFRFLAESSTVLSSSLDYGVTLSALARLCVPELADWVVIYTVERGQPQRLEVAHRDPAKAELVQQLRNYAFSPKMDHPLLEVLRTQQPLLVRELEDAQLQAISQDARHFELCRQLGAGSVMLVPLVARERSLGAIALVSSDPSRRFGDDDLPLAQDLALRAALAVDNARLYREARQADQAKSDLLAVIAHDLRTPLNSILGYADLLSIGIPDKLSDAAQESVERVRNAAGHLVYLIDQLLEFARLDAGHEQLRVREVEARELASQVCEMMEPLAHQRGLRLALGVPDDPVLLDTDPDRLRQILLNLLGNAVKYTREGVVALEVTETPDRGVVFHVRDTGVGISREHLERIFEPFWRGDETGGAGAGAGLGLSVVRRLVQLLGGSISVESAPGEGSTFTVTLPPAGAARREPRPREIHADTA